jgi:hypothetical protein
MNMFSSDDALKSLTEWKSEGQQLYLSASRPGLLLWLGPGMLRDVSPEKLAFIFGGTSEVLIGIKDASYRLLERGKFPEEIATFVGERPWPALEITLASGDLMIFFVVSGITKIENRF